jgi:G3E family GTPase
MDELADREQAKITFEIQGMNPKATCLLTSYSDVSISQLRNLSVSLEKNAKHVDLNLSSFVYSFKKAIHHEAFEEFLKGLPDTIYRIKGYVKFSDSQYPFLFQFSYGMPLYMKEEMNMPLNLVFIGEKMEWNVIQEQLANLEK